MPDKKVLVVTIGLGTLLLLPILRRLTRQNRIQGHEGLPTSNTSCKKSGVRRRIPAFFHVAPTPVKKRERVRFADERVLTDSVKVVLFVLDNYQGSSPLEEFIPDYSEVEREDSIPVISQDLRLPDSLPNNSGSNNSTRFINRNRSFSCYFFLLDTLYIHFYIGMNSQENSGFIRSKLFKGMCSC